MARSLTEPDKGDQPASDACIAYVEERLSFHIGDFAKKRDRSKCATNWMRAASIIFGTAVTILIGAKSIYNASSYADKLTVGALFLSAAVTALNSWESFSRHPGKWIQYRSTLSMLYTIRDQLSYRQKLGPLLVKDVDAFFNQIMFAVHEANQEWMNVRGPIIGGIPNKKA